MLTEKQRILRLECLLLRIYDALPLFLKVSLPKDAITAFNTMTDEINELAARINKDDAS